MSNLSLSHYSADQFSWEEPLYTNNCRFLWVSTPLGDTSAQGLVATHLSLETEIIALYAGHPDEDAKRILDWIDSLFISVAGLVMSMVANDTCEKSENQDTRSESQDIHPAKCLYIVSKICLQHIMEDNYAPCILPESFPFDTPLSPLDTFLSQSKLSNIYRQMEPVSEFCPHFSFIYVVLGCHCSTRVYVGPSIGTRAQSASSWPNACYLLF